MLNLIRDTLKYSKWILLFIVVSFVLFYGVDWTQKGDRGGREERWIARVDGADVDPVLWQQQYRRLDDQYRQMFGKQYDQVRKSLDLPRQAIEQVVQTMLVLRDAKRLGLSVSNDELSAVITSMPTFQRNGAFVGAATYENMLRSGMAPPYRSAEEFEAYIRDQLLLTKWQSLLRSAAVVTDQDVAREYHRRH